MSENEKLVERLRSLALYNGAGALGSMQYGLQEAATALTLAQARISELETALAARSAEPVAESPTTWDYSYEIMRRIAAEPPRAIGSGAHPKEAPDV